jgi:hypothetical protein
MQKVSRMGIAPDDITDTLLSIGVTEGRVVLVHADAILAAQFPPWSELAGGGSLTPGGLYTAGTTTASSGGMPVSATLNGATENATVGVTGGVPGVVSEISDYIDYTLALPLGTNNEQVAVSGTHLYALASGNLEDYVDRIYFWIDVYDISDPYIRSGWTPWKQRCAGPCIRMATICIRLEQPH